MSGTGYAGIVEIERGLDGLLRNQVPDMQFVRTLRAAEREWSEAIWSTALALGAAAPSSTELGRGLRLAQRPVLICGAARSGPSTSPTPRAPPVPSRTAAHGPPAA